MVLLLADKITLLYGHNGGVFPGEFDTTHASEGLRFKSGAEAQVPVMCVCAQSLQLCLTLCNCMDHSPPGSSVHGILLARILGWTAILPVASQFNSLTQSCPTLCNPMDCSTPGLPVHHQLLEFTQTHVH